MQDTSTVRSSPIILSSSTLGRVYALFALALALTAAGVYLGLLFAPVLLHSGVLIVMLIASLALIFTAQWWMEKSPLNVILFGVFPLLMGITFTPYLLMILATYVNAGAILLNALAATACTAGAAAVFGMTTKWDLSFISRVLFFALIGLLVIGLLQIFIPALRTGGMEILYTGGGVVLFSLFTAYDVQKIQRLAATGASPFLLALTLYLDIYNLFLFILRFLLAIGGGQRR